MRIDLHTHSRCSDGTQPPAELMAVAAEAGLDVIALTDHDTTAGWQEAARARPAGLTVVPGLELSCASRSGSGPPIGVHLLGYLFDPYDEALRVELARLQDSRRERARRMVQRMADDGLDISWDRVSALAGPGAVGRPHLARALVDAGLAPSISAAFEGHLRHGGPYYLRKADIEVHAGVRLIRAAGGVPVLAHALARRRGRVIDDGTIAALAGSGLLGLEVDHPDHVPADRDHLRGLATELDLIVTGSSDYHGANKPTPIGACTTDPAAFAAIRALSTGFGCLAD